jgi:hypothetical protein
MNLSAKIDLTSLIGAQVQTAQDGTLALIIPIQANDLYYSQKGRVYLDLSIWERRNGPSQYGDTHDVKQSYSQAKRQTLPQGAYPPSLGHAREIKTNNQATQNNPANVYAQPAPQGYVPVNAAPQMPQAQPTPAPQPASAPQPTDNLPF